jgi:hypothetical protein
MEFEYKTGPRISEEGLNFDSDISAAHPKVIRRRIEDPVSDGSLGPYGYEPGQFNLDGSQL